MAEKTKAQKDWEYPDYSQATADDFLQTLLAMRPGQPEDALTKADAHLPRLPKEEPDAQ